MGMTAENVAERYGVTRYAQDAMAVTPAAKVPERDAAIADRDAAIHEDRDPAKTDAPAANRDSRH